MKIFAGCFAIIMVGLAFSSCGPRQLTYFQGTIDTTKLSEVNAPEPVIQKGDLLSIVVYSDNPQATALYNQPVVSTNNSSSGSTGSNLPVSSPTQMGGYLVDQDGNIQFQGLGRLHVDGLTRPQLVNLLDSKLKDSLLNNPYYSIRWLNYKITLLGDVNRPGVYNVPAERVSILDAIGLAGDLTLFGKRDNIMIIREVNGKREFGTIDLSNPESISSPYYYLRQNDMVIVHADKRKVTAQDQTTVRNVSIATSVISAVGIIISLITR
jgi:polysaccharide export outer membrane protein